jgi:hypothetical protein
MAPLFFTRRASRSPSAGRWPRRRLAALALATALALACAGCGDDPSRPPTADVPAGETDTPTPPPDVPDTRPDAAGEIDGGSDPGRDAGGDVPPPPDCECDAPSGVLAAGGETARVTVSGAVGARRFSVQTTQDLTDGLPANPRVVSEEAGRPYTATGCPLFDALYAIALEEVRECSVASIQDLAFRDGAPLDCPPGGCFETGRKWNYVWTRDTAYAVDLGLALIDPLRAQNSLEFKLSPRRDGSDWQIVQDTGTGGSYPISTDRVVWAFGARRLLHFLAGAARTAFAAKAFEAMRNTAEHDRVVVFDPEDGLYRGEQSFLDWREQSYPQYTANDTVHIGMSKALSTNAGHHELLRATAALAREVGDAAAATRYDGWADALAAAIRERLWLAEDEQFATFVTTTLDPAPARRFDALGTALTILSGIATEEQAAKAVSRYPLLPTGPPVLWPQQQEPRIYHNRGIWPFVTAYWLRAARATGNAAAVVVAAESLRRGAALNLSNMENFEMVTLLPWVDDDPRSGPVVNSQRQLWSVAGYLTLVHDIVFGLESSDDGIRFRPFLPAALRNEWFCGEDELVLHGLPYRGVRLTVRVALPPTCESGAGVLRVQTVTVDGRSVAPDAFVAAADLTDGSEFRVVLAAPDGPSPAIRLVAETANEAALFGPQAPAIQAVEVDAGRLRVRWQMAADLAPVRFAVYRDGQRVADGLPTETRTWSDEDTAGAASPSYCYTVEAYFAGAGGGGPNVSQRAAPYCYWGPDFERVAKVDAPDFDHVGGQLVDNHGRWHIEAWGDQGHTITIPEVVPRWTGRHLVQVEAGNGAGPLNTGITCAVKRLDVYDADDDAHVAGGYLMMPHMGLDRWDVWRDSNFVPVDLVAGRTYRFVIHMDEAAVNMSSFRHFEDYSGGRGGSAPFHHVNISTFKLLARDGT